MEKKNTVERMTALRYCFDINRYTWPGYLSPGDFSFPRFETLSRFELFLPFSRSNRYTCTNAGLRASSTSFTWLPQKKRDDRINISHTDFSWSPTSTSSPTPDRCSSYPSSYSSFSPLSKDVLRCVRIRIRVRTTEHLIARFHVEPASKRPRSLTLYHPASKRSFSMEKLGVGRL